MARRFIPLGATVTRALIALVAVLVLAPPVEAQPANRARKPGTRPAPRATTGAKVQPATPARPDRGHVPPDRAAVRAKVKTGDRPRHPLEPARRTDASKLPLDEQVARKIEELLRGPLRDGTTSLLVADAATGKPLFSVYPDDPLNPASNVKLIATAAALDLLGPDFRYVTRVLGPTPDAAGQVTGDVYLLGSYDPTLSARGLERLAEQLVAAGVRRIDGDVVVGETSTRDGIYRSLVQLSIAAGAPGQPPRVTVTPASDLFEVEVAATTARTKKIGKGQGIAVQSAWVDEEGRGRMKVVVKGQIPPGRTLKRDVWTRERGHFAAHLLRQALRDAGVELTGDVQVSELRPYLDATVTRGFVPVPLAEHRSARLAEIVQRINKRSTNWLADRVIMTAAARRYGGKPSMDVAIDAMYAWLEQRAGLGRDELVIDTGSGLSYRTELSARQVVRVLRTGLGYGDDDDDRARRRRPLYDAYRASLAIGGQDGTIRGRFRRLEGTVIGKTGTLARVISLAGVVEVEGDRRLVFSVISNGHRPHWKGRVRAAHERLVGLLCDYLRQLPATTAAAAAAPAPEAAPAAGADREAIDELLLEGALDDTDVAGITERADR
jgi:serine-type D-Ala-D-Ala carboxypeptidase/endopeptidase (penicillin-binding protein 4)